MERLKLLFTAGRNPALTAERSDAHDAALWRAQVWLSVLRKHLSAARREHTTEAIAIHISQLAERAHRVKVRRRARAMIAAYQQHGASAGSIARRRQ